MMRMCMRILAGTMLAALLPWLQMAVQYRQKATGIAVLIAIFRSPVWWFFAVLFSALFWAASRFENKLIRIVLFWTPAILISTIGLAAYGLFLYLFFRFPRG
jgi:hypothetical protein